jgi:hypothetical protein
MTRNVEVWKLAPGDVVNVHGESMIIKNIDAELNGLSLNLLDTQGRGHYQNYGHDDIVPLVRE